MILTSRLCKTQLCALCFLTLPFPSTKHTIFINITCSTPSSIGASYWGLSKFRSLLPHHPIFALLEVPAQHKEDQTLPYNTTQAMRTHRGATIFCCFSFLGREYLRLASAGVLRCLLALPSVLFAAFTSTCLPELPIRRTARAIQFQPPPNTADFLHFTTSLLPSSLPSRFPRSGSAFSTPFSPSHPWLKIFLTTPQSAPRLIRRVLGPGNRRGGLARDRLHPSSPSIQVKRPTGWGGAGHRR